MSATQQHDPLGDGPDRERAGPREQSGSQQAPERTPERAQRWGFGAFLLVEAVLLASAAFVTALLQPDPDQPVPIPKVLIGTISPTMTAAATALLITRVRGNGPRHDLRLSWRWDDVRVGLWYGLLGLVLAAVGAFVWTEIVGGEEATSAIAGLVEDRRMSVWAIVTMFVYLWLVGPICEELIYRGLLWRAVERLHWARPRWGRFAAFLISTAVFAVSHLEPMRTALLLVIAVPIGLARLTTGRLLASIVAHQVNNFLPAVAILLTSFGVLSA